MRNMRIVNVVPNDHSNETNDDAEPSVTVNPSNIDEIVVTAFTPTEGGNPSGPFFVSTDGGENWIIRFDIPGGETHDQSPLYGGTSDQLYMGTLRGDTGDLNVLRTADPSVGTADLIESRSPVDQPWVEATTVRGGPGAGAAVRRVQPERQRQVRHGGGVPRRARGLAVVQSHPARSA